MEKLDFLIDYLLKDNCTTFLDIQSKTIQVEEVEDDIKKVVYEILK